ncbi:MAG: sialidase family protein [Planctomycetia bacterium]|nr:sialidase family protein [Planctomycetia bacterium]
MKKICLSIIGFVFCLSWIFGAFSVSASEFQMTSKIVQELPPGEDNPRNSEGDFIRLKDGQIIFVYSQYFGNSSSDHAHANLAQLVSSDNGETWSKPEIIVRMDGGMNIMSVSLHRMQDGRIGLFYLRKFSASDCRLHVRFSEDEAKTWSEPTCCMNEVDYYVVNNARIIQLRDGTVLIPAALHHFENGRNDMSGEALCFRSTDGCKTFQREKFAPKPKGMVFQEPGLVELADGTIFMYVRTTSGSQFGMKSSDGGKTWGEASPTHFISPCSPLLIRPIPETDRYLAVWNEDTRHRNPLTLAVLDSDLNFLWKTTLDKSDETAPRRFCYPAILSLGDGEFLISYCAGHMPTYGLEASRIVKIKLTEKL